MLLNLAKYGLGHILDDFFTKAFGHAEVKRYLKLRMTRLGEFSPIGCLFSWADQLFGLLISTEKSYELSLTKNGLGYVLGNILKNPSGHPL
jgi:hypothetical protein